MLLLCSGVFFGGTMVMISIALIMAGAVTNIYSKKDTFTLPNARLVRWARRWDPKFMKNFPYDEPEVQYAASGSSAVRNTNGRLARSRTPPTDLVVYNDSDVDNDLCGAGTQRRRQRRNSCFTCCGERRKRKRSRNGSDVERSGSADRAKSKRFLYSVTHSRQAGYTRTMQQSFDTERNSMEWQLLTKFIDRHLLIVYFIGTMTAQIWLAYEMLGSHGDKVQGNTV